jgi:hypothetical protein
VWRGRIVRMRVHSRRWFCGTPTCPRKIFAERFDGALPRYARRTDGTTELLTTFALQADGEGGARLAHKAGVPISPDTLLRILHSLAASSTAVRRRQVVEIQRLARPTGSGRPSGGPKSDGATSGESDGATRGGTIAGRPVKPLFRVQLSSAAWANSWFVWSRMKAP